MRLCRRWSMVARFLMCIERNYLTGYQSGKKPSKITQSAVLVEISSIMHVSLFLGLTSPISREPVVVSMI
jgi:hypothetical protein